MCLQLHINLCFHTCDCPLRVRLHSILLQWLMGKSIKSVSVGRTAKRKKSKVKQVTQSVRVFYIAETFNEDVKLAKLLEDI